MDYLYQSQKALEVIQITRLRVEIVTEQMLRKAMSSKLPVTVAEFQALLELVEPPDQLTAPLAALWWDAKGDWRRAHELVDALETPQGMAVHADLHRKEGVSWNADYWYSRAGRHFHRPTLDAEWQALVEGLLK